MSEKERKIEVELNFTIDSVRAAAKNASNIEEVMLDVPCVDPRKLSIDDKIYGLKVVPVKDSVKRVTPSTLCTVGVIEINVDTLSGVVKPGYVVINNRIEVPKELGQTNNIQDVYMEDKEAARAVAMVFLEEEATKAEEAVEAANEIRDFLLEQLKEGRV